MTDHAAQLAALLNEAHRQGFPVLDAVAAVLAPLFERVEAMEARGKAMDPVVSTDGSVRWVSPQPGASRGAEVAEATFKADGHMVDINWNGRTDYVYSFERTVAQVNETFLRRAVAFIIDAERAAAHAEAIDAAERAVREFPSAALHRGVFNEVADAVARLREVPHV